MALETPPRAEVPHARRTGARRAGRTGSGGLRRLLSLLLGLLLAALLAILLISLTGGGDESDDGGTTGSDAGQLTAGTAKLLPPPGGGLTGLVGETATGKDAAVRSVNGNEVFSVGSSAKDRVYIEWGGDVGRDETSRFQPQKGHKVNLTGPVQRAGRRQIQKLKLSAADAEVVRSQGAFVNADRVSAAK
jgi:hypothetical protein